MRFEEEMGKLEMQLEFRWRKGVLRASTGMLQEAACAVI